MSGGRSRPGLLLGLLLPMMLLVQGGLYSFLYPRFALLAWLVPAVFGGATAGAALYSLPGRRPAALQWSAGIIAVAVPLATAAIAATARNLLLLERHGQASPWSLLAQPGKWWALQQRVVGLDICCSRGGGVFSPLAHWSFLALELAATAAGAVYIVLALQRQRRPDGGLPD